MWVCTKNLCSLTVQCKTKDPVCHCVQCAPIGYVWVPVSGSRKPPTVGHRQSKGHSRNALRTGNSGEKSTFNCKAKPFLSPQPAASPFVSVSSPSRHTLIDFQPNTRQLKNEFSRRQRKKERKRERIGSQDLLRTHNPHLQSEVGALCNKSELPLSFPH